MEVFHDNNNVRKALITHWLGKALETLCDPKYLNLSNPCFENKGLITADGSEDQKIRSEGLRSCKIFPPILYLLTCDTELVPST